MCRYALTAYKPHLACFRCRKAYKRRLLADVQRDRPASAGATCPQCRGLLADMGLDFAAPPQRERLAWHRLELGFRVGFTFHSCGCSGPGYVPRHHDEMAAELRARRTDYVKHRRFWLTHSEPVTKLDRAQDRQRNWAFYAPLPEHQPTVKTEEAAAYWSARIAQVEERLQQVEAAARRAVVRSRRIV